MALRARKVSGAFGIRAPMQLNMTKTECYHPLQEAQPTKKEKKNYTGRFLKAFPGRGRCGLGGKSNQIQKQTSDRPIGYSAPNHRVGGSRGRVQGVRATPLPEMKPSSSFAFSQI